MNLVQLVQDRQGMQICLEEHGFFENGSFIGAQGLHVVGKERYEKLHFGDNFCKARCRMRPLQDKRRQCESNQDAHGGKARPVLQSARGVQRLEHPAAAAPNRQVLQDFWHCHPRGYTSFRWIYLLLSLMLLRRQTESGCSGVSNGSIMMESSGSSSATIQKHQWPLSPFAIAADKRCTTIITSTIIITKWRQSGG